ncbi:restriction endonuclease [Flavobacterium sp. 3-210]
MAKRNNGKSLEKTIQLIQEAFKDYTNTKVYLSHKLICESGIEREFDVVIKSKINDFDICIAIECKDFGKKVSLEKIEAFKSKCSTVKEINKMVFVSTNGFQTGAITQAKNFGIELMTAEQVSLEYLENLLVNFWQYHLEVKEINPNYQLTLGGNDLNVLQEFEYTGETIVFEYKTKQKVDIRNFIKKMIEMSGHGIQGLALNHLVQNKHNIEVNSQFPVFLGLSVPASTFYIEDINKIKVDVIKFEFEISIKLNKLQFETSGRVIKNEDDSIKAHSVKFKISDDAESEIIVKPNNEISYYFTEKKETTQLKKLFVYDPETNKVVSCRG